MKLQLNGAVFKATVNGVKVDIRQLKDETAREFLARLQAAIDAAKENE